jgi:HSP20 family molecular chaperone IbpA
MDFYTHPLPQYLNAHPMSQYINALSMFDHPAESTALDRTAPARSAAMLPRYNHVTTTDVDVLEVELPGVDKKDVKIELKGFTLFVTAERVMPHHAAEPTAAAKGADKLVVSGTPRPENGDQVHVNKNGGDPSTPAQKGEHRQVIKYAAKFSLAKIADLEAVSAECKNGLLRVTVPHKKPAEARKIELF